MWIETINAKEKMVIEEDIKNENGVVILAKGQELKENLIKSLLKHGITEINVKSKLKENTVPIEIRSKAIDALKDLNIKQILESSSKIANSILNSSEFRYSLTEYKENTDIFEHSMRVAAFAAVLAKYYNEEIQKKPNSENKTINVEHVVTAALVHDLGKTLKNDKFNINLSNIPKSFEEDLPGIKNVPKNAYDPKYKSVYTYCILKHFPISTETKLMALLVDENDIEKGPLQATEKFMKKEHNYFTAAKMIRLCSFYDDILKLIIENDYTLENVPALLEAFGARKILDKDLTQLFINHIPLYSVGIKVKLSDGRLAVVVKTFTEHLNNYKPIVRVISTNELIDLRKTNNLTISQICSEELSYDELVASQIIGSNNNEQIEEYKKAI